MIVILAGTSGSGKTSSCGIIAEAVVESGSTIGGVLCAAVFEGGVKVGIDFRDMAAWPGGAAVPMARVRPERRPEPADTNRAHVLDRSDLRTLRYGMWDFDAAALALADETVSSLIAASVSVSKEKRRTLSGRLVVIIDEIGPLELEHGAGMTRTLAALDGLTESSDKSSIDCLVVARPDIADRLEARWPGSRRVDIESLSIMDAVAAVLATLGRGD